MRKPSRSRSAILYGTLAGLFSLVLIWWMVFFSRQGSLLVRRLDENGAGLSAAQSRALEDAASHSSRMFMYEGGFLALIGLLGMWLVLRSLRRELLMHRQQRDFLSAVTHELRSPIAAARLQVESLHLGRVPEAKVQRYLARTIEDLDRLSVTVNQLLEAARSNSGRVELSPERVELGQFLARSLAKFKEGQVGAAEFVLAADSVAVVLVDPVALETVFSNLLSNAVKYGGDPPRIRISTRVEGRRCSLEVWDSGSGISGQEANRIFDPFVRGQGELVKKRPGIGLGLYLVAELSASMGAEVSAKNHPSGQGFGVTIKLPLAPDVGQRGGTKS